MARTKQRKQFKKRRITRRRRRKRVKKNPMYPLGQQYVTTLKYVEKVRFNSQTDGQGVLGSYNANSLYDPNASGGGHQPMGFDQLCGANNSTAFFGKYTVIGAKIRVDIMGLSNNNSILLLHKGANFPGLSDGLEKILEQGNVTYRMVPASGNNIESSSATTAGYSGANKFTLRSTYSPVKDGLVSKGNVMTDGVLTAPYNLDPAQPYYWTLCMLPFNQEGGTGYTNESIGTISAIVTIEYRVIFTDPNLMVQS